MIVSEVVVAAVRAAEKISKFTGTKKKGE